MRKDIDPRMVYGQFQKDFHRAETHTHTSHNGGDGLKTPEEIVEKGQRAKLHTLVFTDHDDTTSGHVATAYRDKKGYPIEIVTGAEVTAIEKQGLDEKHIHVLGIGLRDNIPFWKTPEDTIATIHQRGGLAVIPHPGSAIAGGSMPFTMLDRLIAHPDPEVRPDGIEIFNGGMAIFDVVRKLVGQEQDNKRALAYYKEHAADLAAVGGTDIHYGETRAWTTYPPGMSLHEAIKTRQTGVGYKSALERINPISVWDVHTKSRRLDVRRHKLYNRGEQVFPPKGEF